jgi:hypothetical protein
MSDNGSHDDEENERLLDDLAGDLVKRLGVTPEAGRLLIERAEVLALLAMEIAGASHEEAAAAATRSILDTVRAARRGYRHALQIFGPGGPPEDDADEEVPDHAAAGANR